MLPNDVGAVKKSNTKIQLLTGTSNLQRNQARFDQYAVDDICTLCLINAESQKHFFVECSRPERVMHQFRSQISKLLLQNNSRVACSLTLNNDSLTQLLFDSTV